MSKLLDLACRMLPAASMLSATFVFAAPSDTLSLLFVGDLMQHREQINAARRPNVVYDYSQCFSRVASEIRQADLAIGNLEVTLGGKPYSGYPAFSAPDEWLYAIREAGFNVLLTANNHCLDRGRKGLERTLDLLDSLQVARAGTYRCEEEREARYPLLLEKKGFRVALLNYTYGTNGLQAEFPNVVNYINREQIRRDIWTARQMRPDVIIACMHWGIEYRLQPERSERDLADWMLGLGVDHVVGSHSHVVQPVEVREDSVLPQRHVVAYSLGNFVSNMSQSHTDGGLVLRLKFCRRGDHVRLADSGYAFVWTSRPRLSGRRDFVVYTSGEAAGELAPAESLRMSSFLKDVRNRFSRYAKGIKEFFFERKNSQCLQNKNK